MSDNSQVGELFQFLTDANPQVVRIALASLLPYTAAGAPERQLFLAPGIIEQIGKLCFTIELISHDALSALINLSSEDVVCHRLFGVKDFLEKLVEIIVRPKAVLADLACMLLSNLTKVSAIGSSLLSLKLPASARPEDLEIPAASTSEGKVAAMDLLVEVFLKGEGKKWNSNAEYDFLASVFANVSTTPAGRSFLLSTSTPGEELPLSKLISFTEHPSLIRRGSVASTMKNSAFEKSSHHRLMLSGPDETLEPGSIDLLPQILLPLCGPEEFDLDVMDLVPTEVQLLGPSKKREPDPAIRSILLETLVLLCTTRSGRETMRKRGVYEVIKLAHLAEIVPAPAEQMVRLVNLLMRDEAAEVEELEEEAEPAEVTEVKAASERPAPVGESPPKRSKVDEPVVPPPAPLVKAPAPEVDEDDEDMVLEVL